MAATASSAMTIDDRKAGGGKLGTLLTEHPALGAAGLLMAQALYVAVGALALRTLAPSLSGFTQSGVLTVLNAPLWMLLVARLGWWRRIGFVGRGQWRNLGLAVFPAALTLLPLIGGVRAVGPLTFGGLLAGYAATALMEETIFRGILLDIFSSRGIGRAIAISSILFGVLHLENVLFRDNVAMVLAQAIGVTCFGVGYAALRLRTNTIWLPVALHFMTDLLLQLTALPLGAKIGLMVGQDTALLIFGLLILRHHTGRLAAETAG